MIYMNLVCFLCVLVAAVGANLEEDMFALREKKDVSEIYKRATPADYRYTDNYYNPYTKPDYYNNQYNPAYNNRFYSSRNYPFDGRPYGTYGTYTGNQQYYPGYYNNTRYQYGNYPGYQGSNYPASYNYPNNYPYNTGKYADRYYNPGYYQDGYYNNPGFYNKA